ncbi:hypothetical protein RJT34_19836 [Clitoria ternatea]|uniref:Uncharacterized protein n=1 Tax=Clitoria ternatea TaxID=43366 RepID=A0AAN9P437_CLITE
MLRTTALFHCLLLATNKHPHTSLSSCVFKIVTQTALLPPHWFLRFLGAVGVLRIIHLHVLVVSCLSSCELFADLTQLHCLF